MINTDSCKDYFDQVVAWAKENGLWENPEAKLDLKSQLDYLDTYADDNRVGDTKCVLYADFAPQSFAFVMYTKGKDGEYHYWFQGGLIFHGAGSSGAGAPELSVRLGDTSRAGWSVHT